MISWVVQGSQLAAAYGNGWRVVDTESHRESRCYSQDRVEARFWDSR